MKITQRQKEILELFAETAPTVYQHANGFRASTELGKKHERDQAWKAAHPKRVLELQAEYRARHKAEIQVRNAAYRAKKKATKA